MGCRRARQEVGKKFGVTRERIRQLQNIALAKLRRALSEKETPDLPPVLAGDSHSFNNNNGEPKERTK
jgi:hypothetical protein